MTFDDRFTWGLVLDVINVLERHGYHQHDTQHTGQAVAVIGDLAQVYDGTRDVPYGTYSQPTSHAEPAPSGPGTDDAVILTNAEVSTVSGALAIAADVKRDRAAACADQSCLTCQSQLRDARAYDQMAVQLQETAEAARTANAGQAELASPPSPPGQSEAAGDKEAGQ